ncbi:MAG: Fe2+-dependent dioxygenase [Polyangiaceae bacterium]
MLFWIPDLLDARTLEAFRERIEKLPFKEGRATLARGDGDAKHNQQLDSQDPEAQALGREIVERLLGHPEVRRIAIPRSVRHPLIARYTQGMHFARHVDLPVMGGASPTRTDFACTLWLSEPESYEGGELVIHAGTDTQRLKGAAGSLLLYPACSLHEVTPVTSGTRLVAVTWLQSLVRDHEARRMLAELDDVRRGLDPEAETAERLAALYNQLLRYHAEV